MPSEASLYRLPKHPPRMSDDHFARLAPGDEVHVASQYWAGECLVWVGRVTNVHARTGVVQVDLPASTNSPHSISRETNDFYLVERVDLSTGILVPSVRHLRSWDGT